MRGSQLSKAAKEVANTRTFPRLLSLVCFIVSCGDAGTATSVAGRLKGEEQGLRDPKDKSLWLNVHAHATGHEGVNLVP